MAARTNVLVAIRSANRSSSVGAIATTTLPIRSAVTSPVLPAVAPYGAPVSARTSRTSALWARSSVVRPAGARPRRGTARTSTRAPGTSAPPTACAAETGSATARKPDGSVRPVWNAAGKSASAVAMRSCPRHSGARGVRPTAFASSVTASAGIASVGSSRVAGIPGDDRPRTDRHLDVARIRVEPERDRSPTKDFERGDRGTDRAQRDDPATWRDGWRADDAPHRARRIRSVPQFRRRRQDRLARRRGRRLGVDRLAWPGARRRRGGLGRRCAAGAGARTLPRELGVVLEEDDADAHVAAIRLD